MKAQITGNKLTVLCIFDGWGVAAPYSGNAITEANLPNIKKIISQYPITTLIASGEALGLSPDSAGNSRSGYFSIGTGQQPGSHLFRINKEIEDKRFFKNKVLMESADYAKKNKSNIHFLGLISKNEDSSSFKHLLALMDFFKRQKNINIYLDLIISEKELPFDLLKKIQKKADKYANIEIATITGNSYAMDEYNNWERTRKFYRALSEGECSNKFNSAIKAVEFYSGEKNKDGGLIPTVIIKNSHPVATVKNKDVLIFFNFNPRGMRQIARAFSLPSLAEFPERKYSPNLFIACMTEYEKYLPVKVISPKELPETTLNKILADDQKKQLFIAGIEKYPYFNFFNGYQYFSNEEDRMVLISNSSLKSDNVDVEMSVGKITAKIEKEIKKDIYDFIVASYGNADILGHAGDFKSVVAGLKVVDKNIGSLQKAVLSVGGTLLLTSSHGNCEEMINRHSEEFNPENTGNPVPFIIINKDMEGISLNKADAAGIDLSDLKPTGSLIDIPPTILKIMGIKQPDEMKGNSLL